MSHLRRHSQHSSSSGDYHSFVLRVGAEDPEGSDGPPKMSIRVEHVNVHVTRHFASKVSAFEYISEAIDEFVLLSPS